jgi:transcriptional regulator with XRE-family HTH domain
MGVADADGSIQQKTTRKRLRSPVDRQRADFLKRCRTRLDPAELGLPQPKRKRTEGLRREDVAALSGVSVSWYTWLEQGRDMRVSDDVLERLCHTLRLTEDERVYLFSLVQHRVPRAPRNAPPEAPPEIVRMINGLNVPAIIMNLRWDVLAWNRLNTLIYRDYNTMPAADRNLLEIVLSRKASHLSPIDLESTARRLIARLRFDYSKSDDDPRFEALIRRLDAGSPVFRRIWRIPEFSLRAFGIYRFKHPRYGELAFEHTSSVPDGHPHIRVVICMPDNAAAKKAVAQAATAVG